MKSDNSKEKTKKKIEKTNIKVKRLTPNSACSKSLKKGNPEVTVIKKTLKLNK